MYYWLYGLIAITSLITNTTASIRCSHYDSCIDYIVPGVGRCGDDYTRLHNLVRGHTLEIACERPCTEAEEKKCLADLCKKDIEECNRNPKSLVNCKRALHNCEGPVKMDKGICTEEYMERTVKALEPSTMMCSIDKDGERAKEMQGLHTVSITKSMFDYGSPDIPFVVSCAGLSNKGATEFKQKVSSTILSVCGVVHPNTPDSYSCTYAGAPDSVKVLMERLRAACDQAQAAIGHKTVFNVPEGTFEDGDESKIFLGIPKEVLEELKNGNISENPLNTIPKDASEYGEEDVEFSEPKE